MARRVEYVPVEEARLAPEIGVANRRGLAYRCRTHRFEHARRKAESGRNRPARLARSENRSRSASRNVEALSFFDDEDVSRQQ